MDDKLNELDKNASSEEYLSYYETHKQERKESVRKSNSFERKVALRFVGLMVLAGVFSCFIVIMAWKSMNLLGNFVETTIVENSDFDEVKLYSIERKSFGVEGYSNRRFNYFTLLHNGEEFEVRVPLEMYRRYKEGEQIAFFVDPEREFLLTMEKELISIIE